MAGTAMVVSAGEGVALAAAARPQVLAKSELAIVTLKGPQHRFTVEVARTPEEQATGMMYRRSMAENSGMLFVFPRPRIASFWMQNTYIPLDLIFIGQDGRIIGIHANAKPHSQDVMESPGPAIAVLEIAGGMSSRLGLAPGDRVIHSLLPKQG